LDDESTIFIIENKKLGKFLFDSKGEIYRSRKISPGKI
jgi:hypothetical protein